MWMHQKQNGKDVKDSRGLWRNNRYTVIDTIAYWKPIKKSYIYRWCV
ncbi:Hemoglobin and hemoglobin-haptoglobin binding protein C [Haemophilus influenzae]|uniref:Hemoglobin and hemoglobin-haptoglobin binding protein C n=1 Tax=Haemophilus influenzae TaxID=727 RepID=A0A2X1PT28_HAEIF|nr:Hemoglobin and hemoglobin-haptoglobin binding protein C [Haemophilus influenzae]